MITGPIEDARNLWTKHLNSDHTSGFAHLNAYIYYFEGKCWEALGHVEVARDMNEIIC
jgi:hypothetical protein